MNSKILSTLTALLFCMLAQAQDAKLNKIQKERIEEAIDTVEINHRDTGLEPLDSLSMPWPFYMTQRLDSAMRFSPYMKGVNAGVMVYDMTDNSLLYSYNEKALLKPASNMKLFTSITALDELGADYRLSTKLYHTGEIRTDTVYFLPDSLRVGLSLDELVDSLGNPLYRFRRVLHGNIMGKGTYDPMFEGADLFEFANKIHALQIDSIAGDYLEDDSFRYSYSVSPLQVSKSGGFMLRLKDMMERRGIHSSGIVGTGVCPEDTVLVAEHHHTLGQILVRMMKQSDNGYAENVYQCVNAFAKPVHAVKKLIGELGFNPDLYYFGDGSGLSHDTRVSAELEMAFLRYARSKEQIYPTLYATLPVAGIDGTLSSRMQDTSAFNNVHAKTGTINGVITLGGYCRSANNHELAFVILLNSISSQLTAKALEDELCTIMTHDSSYIPKKKVIVPRRVVRRRPAARRRK